MDRWADAWGVRRGAAVGALVALVALMVGARAALPAGRGLGDCTPLASWGTLLPADVESQVVQLVNAHRATLGLRALVPAKTLTASAEWKSMDMAGYGYMQHDDPAPVARSVGDRLAACGYPSDAAGWGENIAYGYTDARAVMTAWLNDPPHKENLEDPSWTTIGVGAARTSGGIVYWTQDFGTTGAPAPVPAPAPAPKSAPAPAPPAPAPAPPAPAPTPPSPAPQPAPGEAPTDGPGTAAAAEPVRPRTGRAPRGRSRRRLGRLDRRRARARPARARRPRRRAPLAGAPARGAAPRPGAPSVLPRGIALPSLARAMRRWPRLRGTSPLLSSRRGTTPPAARGARGAGTQRPLP